MTSTMICSVLVLRQETSMLQLLTIVNFSTYYQLLRGVFTFLSVRSFSQSEYSFKEELCAVEVQGKEEEWRFP